MAERRRWRRLALCALCSVLAPPPAAGGWVEAALARMRPGGPIAIATVTAQGAATWAHAPEGLTRLDHVPFPRPVAAAALADFDRDGADELALMAGGGVVVWSAAERPPLAAGAPAAAGAAMRVADVDGDDWPDVLVLRDGRLHWWRNVADPLASGRRTLLPHALPRADGWCCSVRDAEGADLDGDGRQEVVLARGDGGALVLIGDGRGGLRAAGFAGLDAVPAERVVVSDLDGDGRSDLALLGRAAGTGGWSLTAVMNRGAQGLEVGARVRLAARPWRWLGVIDWDLDGVDDVVVAAAAGHAAVLSLDGRGWRRLAQVELPAPPRAVVDSGEGRAGILVADGPGATPHLVMPARPPGRHWIGVVLEGHRHRPVADAGIVVVRRDGGRVARRAGARRAAVQLGAFTQWDLLAVYWPGGRVVRVELRGLDRYLTVEEPDPALEPEGDRAIGRPQRVGPVLECGVAG